MNYLDTVPHSKYKCNNCGIHGCKLWREYQTFNPCILCANCTIYDQSKPNISSLSNRKYKIIIDSDGMYTNDYGIKSDAIGWYVPAIPDEEGSGYWGYSSVPTHAISWWKKLPTSI